MVETEARGLFACFFVGPAHNPGISVSHLLFTNDSLIFCDANDTLIFCEADEDQLRNLHCLFLYFEVVSGLRVCLGLRLRDLKMLLPLKKPA
jgi:hypothetical protein